MIVNLIIRKGLKNVKGKKRESDEDEDKAIVR